MKNKMAFISVLLSLTAIVTTIIINFQTAQTYLRSTGKNKALFGLIEMLSFGYQYLVVIPAGVAILLAIINLIKSVYKNTAIIVLVVSQLSLALIFVRVWRVLI